MTDDTGVGSSSVLSGPAKSGVHGGEYGLNLIKRNTGQAVFVITPEVLQDPEGVLERWIRDSYARRVARAKGSERNDDPLDHLPSYRLHFSQSAIAFRLL